jgi:CBS domain-containing protein
MPSSVRPDGLLGTEGDWPLMLELRRAAFYPWLTSIKRPGASGRIVDCDNYEFWQGPMRADQIMTRGVITVEPDASIVEAANRMLAHHISALPVVSAAGELIGIISEGDFIRRAEIGTQRKPDRWLQFLVSPGKAASDFVQAHGRKVGEIMTPAPRTISEQAPLDEIVHIMETGHIKRLPVLRGNQLVGIVTPSNLLQAVADLARDVPEPTADDDQIRAAIIVAIGKAKWAPCRLSVMVRNGVASLGGIVTSDGSRLAAIVAAENVPGVRQVVDHLSKAPGSEECLGGGDFVSLQEQPSTTDDEPL